MPRDQIRDDKLLDEVVQGRFVPGTGILGKARECVHGTIKPRTGTQTTPIGVATRGEESGNFDPVPFD